MMTVKITKVFVDTDGSLRNIGEMLYVAVEKAEWLVYDGLAVIEETDADAPKVEKRQTRTRKPKVK